MVFQSAVVLAERKSSVLKSSVKDICAKETAGTARPRSRANKKITRGLWVMSGLPVGFILHETQWGHERVV